MTILVSGATGFIGGAITRHLLDRGHSVRAMSRSTGEAMKRFLSDDTGRRALAEGRLTFAEADVTKPASLVAAVDGVEAIVQAAQFKGAPVENRVRDLTYDAVDRQGTVNLLEAIDRVYGAPTAPQASPRLPLGSPRFLYMSGITVTPEAQEFWNQAKWQAEEAIRGSGLRWTIVRSCPVYGKGDKAFNRLLGYSDYLPFVPVFGDGTEPISPLFVEDLGKLFALMADDPEPGLDTTFRLGGPDTVTLNELLKAALRARGRRRSILHIPKPIGKTMGALLRHFPGQILSPGAVDFASQGGAVNASDSAFLAECYPQFQATPLRDGLATYMGS